jgi:hypothetical protein
MELFLFYVNIRFNRSVISKFYANIKKAENIFCKFSER